MRRGAGTRRGRGGREQVDLDSASLQRTVVGAKRVDVTEGRVRRLELEREAGVVVVDDRGVHGGRRPREQGVDSLQLPCQVAELRQAAVRPAVVVEYAVPVLLGPEAGGAPAKVRDHLGTVADHLVRVQPHLAAPRRPDRLPPQRPDLLLHHPERDVLQPTNRIAVERGLEPAAAREAGGAGKSSHARKSRSAASFW